MIIFVHHFLMFFDVFWSVFWCRFQCPGTGRSEKTSVKRVFLLQEGTQKIDTPFFHFVMFSSFFMFFHVFSMCSSLAFLLVLQKCSFFLGKTCIF